MPRGTQRLVDAQPEAAESFVLQLLDVVDERNTLVVQEHAESFCQRVAELFVEELLGGRPDKGVEAASRNKIAKRGPQLSKPKTGLVARALQGPKTIMDAIEH